MTIPRRHLDGDWYGVGVPASVVAAPDVLIETSYSFAMCLPDGPGRVSLGEGTGVYTVATLVSAPTASLDVGAYCCVNGAGLIASREVTIGDHALLGWGSVITDTMCAPGTSVEERRAALRRSADDRDHGLPTVGVPAPVVLEENVWVGFHAVVGPGVVVGRGAVIGSRAVVLSDVPPYAVVVGDPARVVALLEPDDGPEVRAAALAQLIGPAGG